MTVGYSIVMFAYNEEKNINSSVSSVFKNIDSRCSSVYVIANGCRDNTVAILKNLQRQFDKLEVVELSVGDKCNAWNEYVHHISPQVEAHFFIDADVQFTAQVFPLLFDTLQESDSANGVAGIPFSGRNKDYYRSLVTDRSCLFGNCYGLKQEFIDLVKTKKFHLPIGLCWIDSAITKAVNTDILQQHVALPNRVAHRTDVGYSFNSLSPFKLDDIKLYFSRIARYQTGKYQEEYLQNLDFEHWPRSLNEINSNILEKIESGIIKPKFYLKKQIINRLKKALP